MTHPIDRFVGRQIRALRIMRGISQEQLGHQIGVTTQQVQKYETGLNRVSASRLYEVARGLDVDIDMFFPRLTPGTSKETNGVSQQEVSLNVKNVFHISDSQYKTP